MLKFGFVTIIKFLREVLLILLCGLMAYSPTMALSADKENFYAQNNILFYDPTITCGNYSTVGNIYKGKSYLLTDEEIEAMVQIAKCEQGNSGMNGLKTEYSQMANLFEHDNKPGENPAQYLMNNGAWYPGCAGSWQRGESARNEEVTEEDRRAVKDVIMEGNRTIPPQIIEYYQFSSVKSHSSDGGNTWISGPGDREEYKSGVTIIEEGGSAGTTWIFYQWANNEDKTGDPFGYREDDPPAETTPIWDSSSVDVDASNNANIIMSFLIKGGYSKSSAAAIVGNLRGENSDFNPRKLEGGAIVEDDFVAYSNGEKTFKGGFGIVQWTSAGRVKKLQEYADSIGKKVTSLEVQSGFLIKELDEYGYTPEVLNELSIEDATWEIYRYYETPASSFKNEHSKNKISPASRQDLSEEDTPSALSAFTARLNHAKDAEASFSGVDIDGPCLNAGGGGATSCGGSATLYTSVVSGKSYCSYKQADGAWGGTGMTSGTISSNGCKATSFAIVLSGFGSKVDGRIVNPEDMSDYHWEKVDNSSQIDMHDESWGCEMTDEKMNTIREVLQSGGALAFNYEKSCGSTYPSGNKHKIAIIDYKIENGKEQIFLMDPAKVDKPYGRHGGWKDFVKDGEALKGIRGVYIFRSK